LCWTRCRSSSSSAREPDPGVSEGVVDRGEDVGAPDVGADAGAALGGDLRSGVDHHEPVHPGRVAGGEHEGSRTSHRMTGHRRPFPAERVQQGPDVLNEHPAAVAVSGPPAAVAALVERCHLITRARNQSGRQVLPAVGMGREAVQEQDPAGARCPHRRMCASQPPRSTRSSRPAPGAGSRLSGVLGSSAVMALLRS
jgi:hypothetical protein